MGKTTSLPSRGAWIEIHVVCIIDGTLYGRSPHGERGLKYHNGVRAVAGVESLPSRGAWIEIDFNLGLTAHRPSRSPHGERGLKFGQPGQAS